MPISRMNEYMIISAYLHTNRVIFAVEINGPPLYASWRSVAGTVTYIIAKRVIAFNRDGHLIVGALISVVASRTYTDALFLLIGSILPDIDHPKSTLGRYNPLKRFMKHRGHAHSLIGGVLLSLPFWWFGERAFLYVLLGCVGHLLGDKLHSWGKFKIKVW